MKTRVDVCVCMYLCIYTHQHIHWKASEPTKIQLIGPGSVLISLTLLCDSQH